MIKSRCRVFYAIKEGENYSTIREMSNVNNIITQAGIEKRKDTAGFDVWNKRTFTSDSTTYLHQNDLEAEDKVWIFVSTDNTLDDADIYQTAFPTRIDTAKFNTYMDDNTAQLLMSTKIKDYNFNGDLKALLYKYTCINLTEYLMRGMVSGYYSKTGTITIKETGTPAKQYSTTAPTIILDMIKRQLKQLGTDIDIYADLKSDGGHIEDTMSDGNSFPTINYIKKRLNLYRAIEELSTPLYTGDEGGGNYIFWLDNSNNVHWGRKSTTISNTINESDCTKFKITKDSSKIFNIAIVHCGHDPYKHGIIMPQYDSESMTKYGPKFKYIPDTGIAEDIVLKERNDNTYNGTKVISEAGFPRDAAGDPTSWIVGLTSTAITPVYVAGTTVVANDVEWKDYIRYMAKEQGLKKAHDALKIGSKPKFKLTTTFPHGTNSYNGGEYIKCIFPSFGWTTARFKKLRIKNISHSVNTKNGWTTNLSLEEDPERLGDIG